MKHVIFLFVALFAFSLNAQTIPKPLREGSKIAIITPASAIDSDLVVKAQCVLAGRGYETMVFPNSHGKHFGSYPAADSLRATDLMSAFADPEIDGILCARGGYGCIRLLPYLDSLTIASNPKWLIGFSDISVLHAMLNRMGIASMHAPMCAHLSDKKGDIETTELFFNALSASADSQPQYNLPSSIFDKSGIASGKLIGGNLMVINELAQTPYDIFDIADTEDAILFVEDVGEKIYAIERILFRWHYSGMLDKVKGLIFGEFTEYKPSSDFETMEQMINYWLREWGYYDKPNFPILFNFPAGHGTVNYPIILGAPAHLIVTPMGSTLSH